MNAATFFFWLIAAFTGVCAIAVVVSQNIVRAAAYLLFTLAGTAGIYFLLGADFVGATQLIVYVGGILVLVVFGVMLTAQGPFISMKTGPAEWFISLAVGILLFSVLAVTAVNTQWTQVEGRRMNNAEGSMSTAELGLAFEGFQRVVPADEARGRITGIPRRGEQVAPPRRQIAYLL